MSNRKWVVVIYLKDNVDCMLRRGGRLKQVARNFFLIWSIIQFWLLPIKTSFPLLPSQWYELSSAVRLVFSFMVFNATFNNISATSWLHMLLFVDIRIKMSKNGISILLLFILPRIRNIIVSLYIVNVTLLLTSYIYTYKHCTWRYIYIYKHSWSAKTCDPCITLLWIGIDIYIEYSLNPAHSEVYSIQDYEIKFASDLGRSVVFSRNSGFLHQFNCITEI